MFKDRIICPETGEDITEDVYQELLNGVNQQRLLAAKLQREAAKSRGRVKLMRDSKGNAFASPKAFIHPTYYFSVLHARRDENSYLKETSGNTWDDDEFLAWELKNNDAIRPIIEKETRYFQNSTTGLNAPVFKPAFSINNPALLI